MLWEHARRIVNQQITHWRTLGNHDWAEAMEECLAKAERYQTLQEAILDLRQRLTEAEGIEQRTDHDAHRTPYRPGTDSRTLGQSPAVLLSLRAS
jgi:hypothetical protein